MRELLVVVKSVYHRRGLSLRGVKRSGCLLSCLVVVRRHWCSGNIGASQALAPGSIPGWRTILVCVYPDDRVQHVVERAYLLGLLAQIKCSICS